MSEYAVWQQVVLGLGGLAVGLGLSLCFAVAYLMVSGRFDRRRK